MVTSSRGKLGTSFVDQVVTVVMLTDGIGCGCTHVTPVMMSFVCRTSKDRWITSQSGSPSAWPVAWSQSGKQASIGPVNTPVRNRVAMLALLLECDAVA